MTRADIKFLRQNNKATGFDQHHPSRLVQTGTEEVYPADFTTHKMVCRIVDERVPLWKSESLYFALKILYRLTHSKAPERIRGAKLEKVITPDLDLNPMDAPPFIIIFQTLGPFSQ